MSNAARWCDCGPDVPAAGGGDGNAYCDLCGEAVKPSAATVPECDAPYPSLYIGADGETRCRCVVCSRCGHHTGNAHQGHFWSYCSKTRKDEGFHFCCPDLPCEYPDNE